jgi:hypothetical protein
VAETHLVLRRLTGRGGALTVVVRGYDTAEEAKRASAAFQGDLNQLLGASLVFVEDGQAVPIGLTLRQLLGSFGVEEVGHVPISVPCGVIETAPSPKIILSS